MRGRCRKGGREGGGEKKERRKKRWLMADGRYAVFCKILYLLLSLSLARERV
jgi:hypothetical protein